MTTGVLHVLPHAGAGAQTYLDTLAELDGFSFETFELSDSRSPGMAAMSILARQPHLAARARRADLLHVHGEIAGLLTIPWLVARPSVVTLHGLHFLRRMPDGIRQQLAHGNLRTIVAAADTTICVSQAERDELRWLPEHLQRKLAVVLNGLALPPAPDEPTRLRTRGQLGLDPEAVAVLYVGQLEPRKDPLTLVRAARRARDHDSRITLVVAGDGPAMADVRAQTDASARLLGQRGDIADLMAAADVFVMPSLREGLSYAVLEAMGHGLAVVVSDAPGNEEAVGDAGLVFARGDERRLADLLCELAVDPARRAALGTRARERITSHLTAAEMREQTGLLYRRAIKAPGRERDGRDV